MRSENLFTIGYQGRTLAQMIQTLHENGITLASRTHSERSHWNNIRLLRESRVGNPSTRERCGTMGASESFVGANGLSAKQNASYRHWGVLWMQQHAAFAGRLKKGNFPRYKGQLAE